MSCVLDQIVSSVNAAAAEPIMFRSGDTISLTETFMHSLRRFFAVPHRRPYVVCGMGSSQASANIVMRDMDEQTSVESLPVFSALLSQLGADGRNRAILPVVLISSDPFHFGVFLQPLPWMKEGSAEEGVIQGEVVSRRNNRGIRMRAYETGFFPGIFCLLMLPYLHTQSRGVDPSHILGSTPRKFNIHTQYHCTLINGGE